MTRISNLALLTGLAFVLVAATAPTANAGHTWNAAGVATKDGLAYRVAFSGHLDQLGPPGSAIFSIKIFLPAPTPSDPFAREVFEDLSFTGNTNFLDATVQPTPFVVQTDYWAESTTEGVSFRMDGTRCLQTVLATGHFQGYELEVAPEAVSL